RTCPLLIVAILSLTPCGFADSADKLAVPSKELLSKSQANVESIFGSQYAKANAIQSKSERRTALAALVKQIIEIHDDTKVPADQYALLQEAKKIAVQAQDSQAVLVIIDRVDNRFQIDALRRKGSALYQIRNKLASREEHAAIVPSWRSVIDAAVRAGRFELVGKLSEYALDSAEQSGDKDSLEALQARVAEISQEVAEYKEYQQADEQLKQKPLDPAANLIVGKYLCIVKGDWENGSNKLALGADEPLKQAAIAELAASAADAMAATQIEVAEHWWKLADAAKDPEQTAFRQRAGYWYKKSLPSLTEGGLQRRRVELRLSEYERLVAKTAVKPAGDPLETPAAEPDDGKIPKFAQKFLGTYVYKAYDKKSNQQDQKIWEFDLDFQVKESGRLIGTWKAASGTRLTVTPSAEGDKPFDIKPKAAGRMIGSRERTDKEWRWELTRLTSQRWEHTDKGNEFRGRRYNDEKKIITIYSNGGIDNPFSDIRWTRNGKGIKIDQGEGKTLDIVISPSGTTYTGKAAHPYDVPFLGKGVTKTDITGKLIPPGQQSKFATPRQEPRRERFPPGGDEF
ncbi:MAG: hypothetical protein VB875_05800, partial [Pirellulales bacterium]